MSRHEDPRGKDLKWAPTSVYRDVAMAQGAFRNSKYMAEQMDDEFVEAQHDELTLLMNRVDNDLTRMREILTDVVATQKHERAALKQKEQAEN